MPRIGNKMQLKVGYAEEYKKRHDEIWPELHALLKSTGIEHYVIFLDVDTHALYASFDIIDETVLDALPQQPIMKKWWAYMADIMEVNNDNSPLSRSLKEVFYMP